VSHNPLEAPTLEQAIATDETTQAVAAATMRRTGHRLNATPDDINLVHDVLFGRVKS
jgi:hypothetical protein